MKHQHYSDKHCAMNLYHKKKDYRAILSVYNWNVKRVDGKYSLFSPDIMHVLKLKYPSHLTVHSFPIFFLSVDKSKELIFLMSLHLNTFSFTAVNKYRLSLRPISSRCSIIHERDYLYRPEAPEEGAG